MPGLRFAPSPAFFTLEPAAVLEPCSELVSCHFRFPADLFNFIPRAYPELANQGLKPIPIINPPENDPGISDSLRDEIF